MSEFDLNQSRDLADRARELATRALLGSVAFLGVAGVFAPSAHAETPLPYSEWGAPKDFDEVAVVIPGGGWAATDRSNIDNSYMYGMENTAHRAGAATLTITYEQGSGAITDVLRFIAVAKKKAGKRPVVVIGSSAGAHLGAIGSEIAGRSTIAGFVGEATPIDLTQLPDPVEKAAATVFAPGLADPSAELTRWSPRTHMGALPARTLLGNALNDPVVPAAQAAMLSGMPGVQIDILPGPTTAEIQANPNLINSPDLEPFTHTMVDKAAKEGFIKKEIVMLKSIAAAAKQKLAATARRRVLASHKHKASTHSTSTTR